VTPASELEGRPFDPFCENSVLAAIHDLADYTHSKAMSEAVTEGKWKPELLITLGKVGLPRYAHFIARHRNDSDAVVRQAVAVGLGLIDNDAITIPVLVELLSQGDAKKDFDVRWESAHSLQAIAARKGLASVQGRLQRLLEDPDSMTAVLAGGVLASAGDPRGVATLRTLAGHRNAKIRQEALLWLASVRDRRLKDVAEHRLRDESLAVRACAIYMLGMLGDSTLIPELEQAAREAIEYEKELRAKTGATDERYGLYAFDPRETLEEAIGLARKGTGK